MACPVARTLDIIGDRWTILVIRDLLLNKTRRFQDFERSMPKLTPAVLSARLKVLERNGIISSRMYVEHPPRPEYFLTEKGRQLRTVLLAMKQWGEKHA